MDADYQLLQRIAVEDDDRALSAIMASYRDPLFRFAMRSVGNEMDAVEIVSEAFVRLYRHAARFRPQAKVSTWLFAITANLCRDYHRRQKRRRWLSFWSPLESGESGMVSLDHCADDSADAGEAAMAGELQCQLEREIRDLPDALRTPFVLYVLEDHSQAECAEILGVTEKAVETRIYRARKRLMERLENKKI
ncbi:MAG: RNA polymerase sigma factor [Verrucomicrobia bacterium]|nr:RNA polymerase sigma factor [Verrucomicrobiota bacterium]